VKETPEEMNKTQEEMEEEMEAKEAASRAAVLEMLGDLPDAEARAPENVLFVVKLNPVTR
jgi:peptidyl-prolyl cis-trans isomerase-like 4